MLKRCKKWLLSGMTVCLVLLMAVFALVGCAPTGDDSTGSDTGSGSSQEENSLQRIAVTTKPAKTIYVVGEKLDLTGMVVTAYYTDGTSEAVTSYTVDKKGELTKADNVVTVSYEGKIAMFPITVTIAVEKALDIETADNAVYTVEGESLDYSNCVNSNDPDAKPAIENVASASGGQSIGGLSVAGNSFGFAVESKVEAELTIVARLAAVSMEQELDSTLSVLWNGESQYSGGVLPWDEAVRDFYNWQNIYFTGLTLEEGTNELILEILSGAPNVDCFWLIVNPTGEEDLPLDGVPIKPSDPNDPSEYASLLTVETGEAQSYRIEAESSSGVDYTNCVTSARDEGTDTASGGWCRSTLGTKGNQFGFAVTSLVEADLTLQLRVCNGNPEDQALDEILKITWNGEEIKTGCVLDFPTEEWQEDPAASVWFRWEDAKVSGLTLQEGRNELNIEVLADSAPNIDYFQLDIAGVSDQPIIPDPPPEFATFVNVEDAVSKVYTVEAEDLDWSKCVNSNIPGEKPNTELPATPTSGRLCVSSIGVTGNKFGFAVESAVEATVSVVLRVSSGAPADQVLDDLLQIEWNETRVLTETTISYEENVWHNWKHVYLNELTLKTGENIFSVEVTGGGCPNIDCFYFIVNPTGEETLGPSTDPGETPDYATFLTVTDGTSQRYTVEAEALDYSECINSNDYSLEPNIENPSTMTSGGASIGGLGVSGNRFGLTVESDTEATLTLTLVVSSGSGTEQVLDDCWSVVWNGEKLTTGYTISWNGNWHEWESVTISGLTLGKGKNVLDITVLGTSPNVDCFFFDVNPA